MLFVHPKFSMTFLVVYDLVLSFYTSLSTFTCMYQFFISS